MKYLVFIFLLFSLNNSFSQTKILIQNNSFENLNKFGQVSFMMKYWVDCGKTLFPLESPPDLHIGSSNFKSWGVLKQASDQNIFIGMVVRDNETHEAIAQKLEEPLEEGKCYKLSLDVAVSKNYLSHSRKTLQAMNYIEPCIIRIWGNRNKCYYDQLLFKSKIIKNIEWEKLEFEFIPEDNYYYIMIEAYWDEEYSQTYCGHVLIDNISDIEEINCNE